MINQNVDIIEIYTPPATAPVINLMGKGTITLSLSGIGTIGDLGSAVILKQI